MVKISTGCPDLDLLFSYDTELLTTIYGEGATGKTTLALQATIEGAKKKKVIFIDTEGGFSTERLIQLAPNYKSFIDNIVCIHPNDLEQQEKTILDLSSKNIGLIIVDTISFFYRLELKRDASKANQSLDRQLKKLSELTRQGVLVLLINQVYTNLKGDITLIGGNMLRNWSKCIISLSKEPRKLKVEKPFTLELLFEIQNEGLVRLDHLP